MPRLLFILVFGVVAVLVNKIQLKRIKKVKSVQEANRIRTFTGLFRAFWPIIGISVYIYYYRFYLDASDVDIFIDELLLLVILLVSVFSWSSKLTFNPFPISIQTKDSFLSIHEDYVLYLRAFHNDNYDDERETDVLTPYIFKDSMPDDQYLFERFCEQFFIEEIEHFLPSCAIGMCFEMESPIGASRIYVDDKTWREDVLGLMEQATWIIVLLEDRESCLWELEQSLGMREKTVYIVDNIEMLSRIKEKNLSLSLPEIPDCYSELQHFFFRWVGDKYIMMPFENTIRDYCYFAHYLFGVQTESDKTETWDSIYSDLNRIWISDKDSPAVIKQRLYQKICKLQQECPLIRDESTTLVDCKFVGNQIVFKSIAKNIDDPQIKEYYEASCQLEFDEENKPFKEIAKYLHIDICHTYSDPSLGKTFEFIINN